MKKVVGVLFIISMLYSAPRKVCIEVFTATWCGYCPYAAYALDTLDMNHGDSIVVIKYHPSTSDPFYHSEAVTRLNYYGVTGYPTTVFDGVNKVVGGWSGQYATFESEYNERISIPSPVQVSITLDFDPITRQVTSVVYVEAESDLPPGAVLRYVVVEDSIFYTWIGRDVCRDVFRDMLPDPSGIPLNLTAGQSLSDTIIFSLPEQWMEPYVYFLAFIQDDNTKEILQADKKRIPLNYGKLVLALYDFIEISGNGNGRFEPGEEINLTLGVTNLPPYGTAHNIEISLVSSDTDVHIQDSFFTSDSLRVGDTLYLVTNISANTGVSPHMVPFVVSMYSDNGFCQETDTFYLKLGVDSLLVWDATGTPNYKNYVLPYLDALNLKYEFHAQADSGLPSILSGHKYIIYYSGDNAPGSQTVSILKQFLDNGGRLFISGQNIAENISDTSFLHNYLKATFIKSPINDLIVVGSGNLFTAQDTALMGGAGSASNQTSKDAIGILGSASPVFYYRAYSGSDADTVAGISYENGTYKVVFFAFGIEGVGYSGAISTVSKEEILRRVLNYLGYNITNIKENGEAEDMASALFLRDRVRFNIPKELVGGKAHILNVAGQRVATFNVNKYVLELNLHGLKPGVYFLVVEKDKVSGKRYRFIITK